MKNPILPGIVLCFALLCNLRINAQNSNSVDRNNQSVAKATNATAADDTAKTTPKKSYVGLSLNFVNDNVYLSRKDSVPVPYLSPKIGYYNKSGLFAEVEIGFNTSSINSGLDLVTIDGGYAFEAGNYDGTFTASKFSYSSKSTSVKSEIKGSIEYVNGYDFGFIKPTLQGGINFGTKTDYTGTFGLEHSFYAAKSKLEITPTVITNAATQNYYSNYYKVRKYNPKSKKKPLPTGVASISGEVLDASAFKVLDYEVSVPLHYETGKCSFGFIPTYAIPVHPSLVAITTQLNNGTITTRTATEKIANTLFVAFELLLKL